MKNFFLAAALLCAAALGLNAQNCAPVVDCNPNPFGYCDETPNDYDLWNETYWLDPLHLTQNLSDGPFEHTIVATDTCAAGLTIRYLLFLDLDNNGTRETVVKSWEPPADGTVNFDNAANPNYEGGEARSFDERPVPANQKLRFALEQSTSGNATTATIKWNNAAAPNIFVRVHLPLGNHQIKWLVANPNVEKVCEQTINMVDCKKPVVVCISGLSVNLMPTQQVTLWASDFLQYTEDNITLTPQLNIAVRKSGAADGQGNTTGFPRNTDGSPQASVTFDCTELGTQQVELWTIDLSDNADLCQTYVIVQDNLDNCTGNPFPQVEACLELENGQPGVEDTKFTVIIQTPGQQPVVMEETTRCFSTENLQIPLGSSYTITPTNNTNPLNGVSTYDMVLVMRHMLGLAPLSTPYKLIAADVDKSNSITVHDLVQLYRTILGIYTEFPQNDSWRFVAADYNFPDPDSPWSPAFPEEIVVPNITDTLPVRHDFIAVKIGDLNGSAIGNPLTANPEDRSVMTLTLPDLTLAAGDVVDLPLRFSEAGEWFGFQASLRFDPALLEIQQVLPGDLPNMNASYIAQPEPGLVRALWFDAQPAAVLPDQSLVSVRVRALAPVVLRNATTLVNDRYDAEAYNAVLERRSLQLVFSEKTSSTSDLSATQVFAPQPNPTAGGFSIPVHLSDAADIQVRVSDLTGKVLYQSELPCSAGSHLLAVPAAVLPQVGVYTWRLQVGNEVKSGKVVRL